MNLLHHPGQTGEAEDVSSHRVCSQQANSPYVTMAHALTPE